jgi:hypothetical protein
MKAIFLILAVPFLCNGQTISTKPLILGAPNKILLAPGLFTTILFPSQIAGVFGLGSQQNPIGAQWDIPSGSNVMVLRALRDDSHVLATVLLDGALYVLDCIASGTPDVAVTFHGDRVPDVQRATEVTPQEIVEARPKYDPQILDSLLRCARDNVILRPVHPDLYQGYQNRDTWFTSDSGTVKTVVTKVHRFPVDDAIVLQGTIENETDSPVTFDGRAVTVQAGARVYPIKYLDSVHTIPAHKRTLIDCVIQGDDDGGRANLSVDNNYRIMLPGNTGIWSLKNGEAPDKSFKVPLPLTKVVQ